MPTSAEKIAIALAKIRGKTVDRLFFVDHPTHFQLFLVFGDGTNYEFYGNGEISGARAISRGDADTVRKQLARGPGKVVEIGKP